MDRRYELEIVALMDGLILELIFFFKANVATVLSRQLLHLLKNHR